MTKVKHDESKHGQSQTGTQTGWVQRVNETGGQRQAKTRRQMSGPERVAREEATVVQIRRQRERNGEERRRDGSVPYKHTPGWRRENLYKSTQSLNKGVSPASQLELRKSLNARSAKTGWIKLERSENCHRSNWRITENHHHGQDEFNRLDWDWQIPARLQPFPII